MKYDGHQTHGFTSTSEGENKTPFLFFSSAVEAKPGFTLIEVLIATAIATVLFLGFFQAYAVAGNVVWNAKARIGGTALATSQVEYLRALPYTSVHTLPDDTKTLNGISYTIRTVVASVGNNNDDDDSQGDEQSNGSITNYKSVKVEARWMFRNTPQNIVLVTYVAP
jgi:prepilin-type N-terminal cleavage/methylation domain-containing protein